MHPCQCSVCLYYEELTKRIDLLPIEHQVFFMKMYDDYVHLQSKYNYHRALVDGSWPNADEVIKLKREKHDIRGLKESN